MSALLRLPLLLPALVLALLCGSLPALADSRLDTIKARGVLRCGSFERPGIARGVDAHGWEGLAVELCKALAVATLGDARRFEYAGYESDQEFARVQRGEDDVFFLTQHEVQAHHLAEAIVPGPTVYVVSNAVMVPGRAPERQLAELAGKGICFLIGDSAENALNEWFDRHDQPWIRHAYSEEGEMNDAYGVQRCHALAAESTRLAMARLYRNAAPLDSRLLPQALSQFPLFAATGVQDARWSALVAWVLDSVIAAERPQGKWQDGGLRALPLPGKELGLASDWQAQVLRAVGNYGALYERTLGQRSPLRLERGANRRIEDGGALSAPQVD